MKPCTKALVEVGAGTHHPNWLREMNASVRGPRERPRLEEAATMRDHPQQPRAAAFLEGAASAGLDGVDAAGGGVLLVQATAGKLIVAAPVIARQFLPRMPSGPREPGRGQPQAGIRNRRETRDGHASIADITSEIKNREFQRMLKGWGAVWAEGITALRARPAGAAMFHVEQGGAGKKKDAYKHQIMAHILAAEGRFGGPCGTGPRHRIAGAARPAKQQATN